MSLSISNKLSEFRNMDKQTERTTARWWNHYASWIKRGTEMRRTAEYAVPFSFTAEDSDLGTKYAACKSRKVANLFPCTSPPPRSRCHAACSALSARCASEDSSEHGEKLPDTPLLLFIKKTEKLCFQQTVIVSAGGECCPSVYFSVNLKLI